MALFNPKLWRAAKTRVSVQLLIIATKDFSASDEINWLVSVDRFKIVGMTVSIWLSRSLGDSSENIVLMHRHAFFDTWDLRESTALTMSLKI